MQRDEVNQMKDEDHNNDIMINHRNIWYRELSFEREGKKTERKDDAGDGIE